MKKQTTFRKTIEKVWKNRAAIVIAIAATVFMCGLTALEFVALRMEWNLPVLAYVTGDSDSYIFEEYRSDEMKLDESTENVILEEDMLQDESQSENSGKDITQGESQSEKSGKDAAQGESQSENRQEDVSQKEQLARIDNHRPGRVCPSGTPAQSDGRIESRTCRIGAIERRFQRPLCRADIRTGRKHPYRNPYREVGRKLLLCQYTTLIVAWRLRQ